MATTEPTGVSEGVLERLVRIEVKLDAIPHADHEARIRKLERFMWLLTPAAATGGGVVGSLLGPRLGGN